jgi:hypothetical protein
VKQLTQIERCEARLRYIRAQHQKAGRPINEDIATTPEAHHIIGKSQNHPENTSLFLASHTGDPAVKVRRLCSRLVTLLAFALPALGDFHLPSYSGHIGFSNLKTMREVISVHVGQACVQIGDAWRTL